MKPMQEIKKGLTERQLRELEYHRQHAAKHRQQAAQIEFEIIESRARRWWNAYWTFYTNLLREDFTGKNVLVVGCGFGNDACYLARLGARVFAFDLSPESLQVAREKARREGLTIDFRQAAAEDLSEYRSDFFDYVVMVDILHHVDIQHAMREIVRVAAPGARIFIDEIYSHSLTRLVRNSRLVEKYFYPRLKRFVYGGETDPYVTEDERKLTEHDVRQIVSYLTVEQTDYFYFVVKRLLPEFALGAKLDRLLMKLAGPLGSILGGRVLLSGQARGKQRVN
ncbi:MAG TPA: class I SAM-dependent methyltransferase [Blastocatellia bacterium]|nr:class I SAM-dependent methyltransferase [Blastocatellia bacterium]